MGGHTIRWPLAPPATSTPAATPTGVGVATRTPNLIGYGLLTPFRRNANDFANGGGAALVKSRVAQILGTKGDGPNKVRGEIPWRTEFGSVLYLLRHKANNPALEQIARVYVIDALARWEPLAIVNDVIIGKDPLNDRRFLMEVRFDIVDTNSGNNAVILPDQSVTVPFALAA